MIRLWKTAIDAGLIELNRLAAEAQEEAQSARRGRRGRSRYQAPGGEEGDQVVEALREYIIKQYDYGFHIADPDIDEIKKRQR